MLMDNNASPTPSENPQTAPQTPEGTINPNPTPQPQSTTPAQPPVDSGPPIEPFRPVQKSRKKLRIIIIAAVVVLVIAAGFGWWHFTHHKPKPMVAASVTVNSQKPKQSVAAKVQGLQLDTKKNYGNKYADGILPVGDGKYSTTSAKKGYVYACSQYAQNLSTDSGGAQTRGPWFTDNNTEYDVNKKLHVQGNVMWTADFSNKVSGSTRTIVTNDLPTHHTGTFPIMSSDPAYSYDRNPNNIKGQTLTFALNADPAYSANPNCMGGEVGVMLTGVALFSAFDAGGRDAGAWEIQDSCDGHPQSDDIYHYHTLSSCIKNVSVHTVIGYALDGFPITGPDVGTNNVLTTSDLDECHGLVSQINLDGKSATMYHYVMTEDFPYSASCYRGKAIQPPGMQEQSQTQQGQQSQTQQGQLPPPKQGRPPAQ